VARGKPKGSPKSGGRQKGQLNKVTRTVKENVIACFDRIGGLEAMAAWAQENQTEFFRLYGRLLPIETQITGELKIVQKVYQ
jgi:hypothetical protein